MTAGAGGTPQPGRKQKPNSDSSLPLPVIADNIPAELRAHPQWVVWRVETRAGKPTKVPYDARTGRRAKSNDRTTWCGFAMAVESYRTGRYAGVGFVLGADDGLAGVDLDHAIDPDSGEIEPWAMDVVGRFGGTYIELSPSGAGFRIFCRGKPQRCGKGAAEKRIELYDASSPRYLTVTGHHWPGSASAITGQQDALAWLHGQYFARKKPQGEPVAPAPSMPAGGDEIERIKSALERIPSDDYETWVHVGMALHAFDAGAVGGALWRDWSRTSPKFDDREQQRKWKSFRRDTGGIKLGTLFQLAKDNGWQPPKAPRKNGRAQRPQPQPDGRPIIELREGEQRRICDESEAALLRRDPHAIFHRGGQLVRMARLDRDEGSQDDPVRRKKGTPTMIAVSVKWLAAEFEMGATYKKYDARTDGLVVKNCPERVPALYLESAGVWRCKPLRGLAEHPYVLPDGTVVAAAGYDGRAGYFLDDGACLPKIPARPTRAAAEASLETILDLLAEFPFQGAVDRSVALAALLTPYIRPGIPVSPLFAFDAAAQGSGKTTLAEVPSMVATGRPPTTVSFSADPAEMEKRLVGLFMAGDTHIVLDNVTCPAGGDFLAQSVSRREVAGRVLGSNTKWQGEPMACISITGNNLQIVGDMPRRTLRCRLDAQMEHPHLRRFRRDLESHIQAHRPSLIEAAVTLLRAYHAAGRPDVGDISPFAGYEPWSRMVRHPIVWLGLPDPLGAQMEVLGRDPDLQKVGAILSNWYAMLAGKKTLLATVVSATKSATIDDPVGDHRDALRAIFLEVAGENGEISGRKLGNYLRAYVDRPVGGYVLRQPGQDSHTRLMFWAVEPAGSAGSCWVNSDQCAKNVKNKTGSQKNDDTFCELTETDPARPRRPRNDPPIVEGTI